MRLVVAITGASGVIYGVRLLRALASTGEEVSVVISPPAVQILRMEAGLAVDPDDPQASIRALTDAEPERFRLYRHDDLFAPFSSGSTRFDAMAIVPCSGGTLGRIAAGTSEDLICRAADVSLKERRKLVLLVREMPLSAIHLSNMLRLAEMGVVIMPACPNFYSHPTSIEDLVDSVVGRVLDQLGIENRVLRRWREGPGVSG